VREGLTHYGVYVEEFGGEVSAVDVSALTGNGLQLLEETILVVSELADLQGDPTGPVEAVIIESRLDKHKGYSFAPRSLLKEHRYCDCEAWHTSKGRYPSM
jgi:translation initiation factor IF-2